MITDLSTNFPGSYSSKPETIVMIEKGPCTLGPVDQAVKDPIMQMSSWFKDNRGGFIMAQKLTCAGG